MSEQQQARILIAEDEANLRLVLQKELERLGRDAQLQMAQAHRSLAPRGSAIQSAVCHAVHHRFECPHQQLDRRPRQRHNLCLALTGDLKSPSASVGKNPSTTGASAGFSA